MKEIKQEISGNNNVQIAGDYIVTPKHTTKVEVQYDPELYISDAEALQIQWGKVYVVDSSQGSLVKRLFEDKENQENLICVSDNKENYPPFSIPKSDIRSLSIVIGVIRLE